MAMKGRRVDLARFEQSWRETSEEVIIGMKEWRLQHPQATFGEIERALDERLARGRAKMLRDVALASEASDWREAAEEAQPVCPKCGSVLEATGEQTRTLQTHGEQEIVLTRQYGECPVCKESFFPPG